MSTTTVRVEPVNEKVRQDEWRAEFVEEAKRRYAAIAATGKSIPWGTMRTHLENCAVALQASIQSKLSLPPPPVSEPPLSQPPPSPDPPTSMLGESPRSKSSMGV